MTTKPYGEKGLSRLSSGRREARATHPVEAVADQDLCGALFVLLGQGDNFRVLEALATDERCPRLKRDALRLAVGDESVAGHEWVKVLMDRVVTS